MITSKSEPGAILLTKRTIEEKNPYFLPLAQINFMSLNYTFVIKTDINGIGHKSVSSKRDSGARLV